MKILIQETLNAIVNQNTTRIDNLITKEIPLKLRNLNSIKADKKLIVDAKTSQGGRSFVPWIAIMNKEITLNPKTNKATVQRGYYIVFLFAKDGSSVYLSLNQGITNINAIRSQYNKNSNKKIDFETMTKHYSELLRNKLSNYNNCYTETLDLKVPGNQAAGYKYQFSNIISIRYDINNVPDNSQIENDINQMILHYNKLISQVPDHEKFITNSLQVVRVMQQQSKKIKSASEFDTTIYDAVKIETSNTFKENHEESTNGTSQTGRRSKRSNITSNEDLNKSIEHRQLVGDIAEEIALNFYKKEVKEKFGEEFEKKVRLITKTNVNTTEKNGHGYGYDLIAYDYEKQTPTEIFVEVKGTQSSSQSSPFEISDNELNKLLEHKGKIRIARVLGVGSKNPEIFEIKGFENYSTKDELLEKKFNIRPTSYLITGVSNK